MEKKCIPIKNATTAFLAEERLRNKGLSVTIDRAVRPPQGCGYCLWVDGGKSSEAESILKENGIRTDR